MDTVDYCDDRKLGQVTSLASYGRAMKKIGSCLKTTWRKNVLFYVDGSAMVAV